MNAQLTAAEIDAIEERAATIPPDWFTQGEPNGHRVNAKGGGEIAVVAKRFMDRRERLAIAAFIAASRDDVPRLIATIRSLRLDLETARRGWQSTSDRAEVQAARIAELEAERNLLGRPCCLEDVR